MMWDGLPDVLGPACMVLAPLLVLVAQAARRRDALTQHYTRALEAAYRAPPVYAIEPAEPWSHPPLERRQGPRLGHLARLYRAGKDRRGTGNGLAATLKNLVWVPGEAGQQVRALLGLPPDYDPGPVDLRWWLDRRPVRDQPDPRFQWQGFPGPPRRTAREPAQRANPDLQNPMPH